MIVALDLDGTLLTCAPRHCAVARYALAAAAAADTRGEFDAREFWRLKRRGDTTQAALLALQVKEEHARAAFAIWCEEIEKTHWLHLDAVLPGTFGAIDQFRSANTDFVLISARQNTSSALHQIASLGLSYAFKSIRFVHPHDVVEGKERALREVGASIYIGDTEGDYLAAHAAGLPCRLVDTGMRDREFLESRTPAPVFSSLSDVFHYGLKL